MGCGNCGTGKTGKPAGCKSNGGCSTGGCNRMNVFDWLSALPLSDLAKPFPVIEVSFNKGSRKDYFRNNTHHIFEKGELIAVEGVSGFDVGQVSLTGELVKLQLKKNNVEDSPSMKKVLRPATEDDTRQWEYHKAREQEVMVRSRAIARSLKLDMKVCEVEIQADGKKATFFYTADQRVDFRELIKIFAGEFRVKVEMRQIGARQESGKVGGIGSCGRELCCSTWLTDFKSVNTTAARYQNLSINQTKLSGQCGRLKCCLNYELDTYMDALSVFPDHAESIQTAKGTAYLQKRDIFKSLMWYSFSDTNKQYPMTIERVREILELNKQGVRPDELQAVELETRTEKQGIKVDIGFVNDVGQISLKALEKSGRRKKSSGSGRHQQGGDGNKRQHSLTAPKSPRKAQSQRQGDQKKTERPPQQRKPEPQRPARPAQQGQSSRPVQAQKPVREGQPPKPAGQNQSRPPRQGNQPGKPGGKPHRSRDQKPKQDDAG